MSTPRAFAGEAATVYLVDDGFQDAGLDYAPLAEPTPIAPAGAGGEAVFDLLYLSITHTMAVTLRLTPVLDGVDQDTIDIVLSAETERATKTFELALSIAYLDPDDGVTELLRYAMRGATFSCSVETTGSLAAGDLIIDRLEVEGTIERESRTAETAT